MPFNVVASEQISKWNEELTIQINKSLKFLGIKRQINDIGKMALNIALKKEKDIIQIFEKGKVKFFYKQGFRKRFLAEFDHDTKEVVGLSIGENNVK